MPRKSRKVVKPDPAGLERYVIEREIGRGGMGIVYRARDVVENRDVALKELTLPQDTTPERAADVIERFKRESDMVIALESPHIVRTYESFAESDRHFIVMEFVDGETLDKLVAHGPLESVAAVAVAEQILEALDVAQDAGIVHRDLKPENIFVMTDGIVKIADFGIARAESGDAKLTRAGQVLGTVGYMPPEQVRGSEVDGRSDIFALGVILYEMLIGTNPFHADQPTTAMYKISYEEPPALDPFVPDMPAYLTPILVKAMAKDPDLRYQSAGAMLADLQSGTAPDVSGIEAAAAAKEAERAKAAAVVSAASIHSAEPIRRLKLSRSSLAALGVCAAILLAAGLGYFYVNNQRAQQRAAQRAAVVAEGKRVAPEVAQMKSFRAGIDSVVISVKAKANASTSASARWDMQFQSARDRYNARVAEVSAHNQQENQAVQNSIQTVTDIFGATYTYPPTYTARLWKMPAYPKPPARLKVSVVPEVGRLDTILLGITALRSAVATESTSQTYMPVVYERLGVALAALDSVATKLRSTTATLVTRDSTKGDLITQSSANGIVAPSTDDSMQKPDYELNLVLENYGVTRTDLSSSEASSQPGN